MQIRLSYKLFGAFFLILAIVVGALVLSRYIFLLNFKNYIHQVELQKLELLIPDLQKEYRTHNGWESIASNPHRWQRLVEMRSDEMGPPGPPPPIMNEPPNGLRPLHKGPHKILLMDADHQPIIGKQGPNDDQDLVAITVNDQIVGWLGLHRREPFESGPPAMLLERQAEQFYILGGIVIGLTAFIAFVFSSHLLRPIQRLIRGTRELANRNFTVRIHATTGDELSQLAKNFNTMAQTLDNYEKMRHQWLTDISHELRTPLSILRGEIEALQDGVRKPTPDNLASLHAEILGISKLVEDLHLLSMADSNKLHLNKRLMVPYSVLETIVKSYQARFSQRQINLDLIMRNDINSLSIEGDADRLGQVFTNILENTFKYVRSPGTFKISAKTEDRYLTFYFRDSGPGVPAEALPRLFDRLYRVDPSRSRNSGGSGLGLSICQHIIENHNGQIWAESNSMGGLTIGIRLPLANKDCK